MTIKEKVLASCKTSYAKYGLKKDELSKLVDQIVVSRGLTDESTDDDVTKAVTAIEPYVGMMQMAFNRAVSETTKKFEGWIDPKVNPQPPTPPTPPTPPITPLTADDVAKMIADAKNDNQKAINEAVAAALAPYKEREEKTRLAALLQGNEKLKDIPEVFRSRYTLDKEENLNNVVEQINNDYTALKQSLVASGTFVAAPATSTPQNEQEDFIKRMEGFSQRNAPKPDGAAK